MKPKDTGASSSALSPSVEALLSHERVPLPQDEAVRSRLLSRAREAVRLAPPAPESMSPPRAALSKTVVTVATGLAVVGGIVAAVLLSAETEPRSSPTEGAPSAAAPHSAKAHSAEAPAAPAPQPRPVSAPAEEATKAPPASSASGPPDRAIASRAQAASSSGRDARLEELQLLRRARQADSRGDYGDVLALVREHERSFPSGRLAEEREVLRVKALVGLGRSDPARRAAARFRRRFPRSVLLHKVDEMVPSAP